MWPPWWGQSIWIEIQRAAPRWISSRFAELTRCEFNSYSYIFTAQIADFSSDHMRTCNPAINLSLLSLSISLSLYLFQSLSRRRHWHWRRLTLTPTPLSTPLAMPIAIAITWCFNQFSANRCKQSKCKNYGNSGGIVYANSKLFLIDKRAGKVCRVRVIVNTVNTL